MTLDCEQLVASLQSAVAAFDRRRVEVLCEGLIEQVRTTGHPCAPGPARAILTILRRGRLFDIMEKVGDALMMAGVRDLGVRTEYVQSLIDQGKLWAAESALRAIAAEDDSRQALGSPPHKVLGLLGRVYKQQYVSLWGSHGPAGDQTARAAQTLSEAMGFYQRAFTACPSELWYGINLVALAARARRDQVPVPDAPDPSDLATHALELLNSRDRNNLPHWDLATGVEASIAIGDTDGALDWCRDYLLRDDSDAFAISSTYRQLVEVWQLDDGSGPGRSLLPLLRHRIVTRPGATLQLGRDELRANLQNGISVAFERVYGADAGQTLSWYKAMMDAARGVAMIATRVEPERGQGSGFLVRARDFLPPDALAGLRPDELFLLTNSHVVSSTHPTALRPDRAVVTFEALEKQIRRVNIGEIVWESLELDAAMLRLEEPVVPEPRLGYGLTSQEIPAFSERDPRRVFVIGHPGGGALTISLFDSLQVGWNDPRLHYRTATEKGNSGSPVFDQRWDVLALHHAAVRGVPREGNAETYDANEGIWIHALRQRALASGGNHG